MLSKYSSVLGLIKLWIYKLLLGNRVQLHGIQSVSHRARLRARKGSVIELNQKSYLAEGTLIRVTEGAEFRMGKYSGFNSYGVVTAREKIIIGDNVMMGPYVSIHDHDHVFGENQTMKTSGYKNAAVIIEDNVWIGGNVTILKGVRIGTGSVIAAGTLINKDVPPHSIVYDKRERVVKGID